MYEFLCSAEYVEVQYEVEYFFHQPDWRVQDIPDPQDDNPERYAIVASTVDTLVHSFNWRLDLGLRRSGNREDPRPPSEVVPEWTWKVGKLPEPLLFNMGVDRSVVLALKRGDTFYDRRNIELNSGYFYTV